MDALGEAESATERTLDKLEAKLVDAKSSLQSTLDNAAELADAQRYFWIEIINSEMKMAT